MLHLNKFPLLLTSPNGPMGSVQICSESIQTINIILFKLLGQSQTGILWCLLFDKYLSVLSYFKWHSKKTKMFVKATFLF